MKFTSMLLYVENQFPTKEIFEKLLQHKIPLYHSGNYLYKIEQKFVSERYFWMYFQYDNANLYADKVIDTVDESEKNNPRPKSQVELREQLFVCYDLEKNLLYVSNLEKKSAVVNYIRDILHLSVATKNIFKSIDEFASVVKQLKTVTFTQHKNICSIVNGSIFQKQASLYGIDLPERSKLKLDYGKNPIGITKNVLQGWKSKRDNLEFDEVIIVGIDDKGMENTFNFSEMVSSVEIKIRPDENCRYNPQDVLELLLEKLGA